MLSGRLHRAITLGTPRWLFFVRSNCHISWQISFKCYYQRLILFQNIFLFKYVFKYVSYWICDQIKILGQFFDVRYLKKKLKKNWLLKIKTSYGHAIALWKKRCEIDPKRLII